MKHLPNGARSPLADRWPRWLRDGRTIPSRGSSMRSRPTWNSDPRGIDPPPPLVEAWNRFYEFHAPRIQSFLKGWKLPEADRSDCFQEVWKEIVGKLGHFHQDPSRGRLSTWLMTLARNKAVDSFRRRNRHAFESLEDNAAVSPWIPTRPGRRIRATQNHVPGPERSDRTLRTGPQTSFRCCTCAGSKGLSTAEVAAALELTPQQVRFRSHRMKQKVRRSCCNGRWTGMTRTATPIDSNRAREFDNPQRPHPSSE